VAKRGKFGARKEPLRCPKDGTYEVGVSKCPTCGAPMKPVYVQYLDRGEPKAPLPSLTEIRSRVVAEVDRVQVDA
jgi:hypothetical protein